MRRPGGESEAWGELMDAIDRMEGLRAAGSIPREFPADADFRWLEAEQP
jgi:hypothetical protein